MKFDLPIPWNWNKRKVTLNQSPFFATRLLLKEIYTNDYFSSNHSGLEVVNRLNKLNTLDLEFIHILKAKSLLAIIIVLEFPPRLSFNNQVKTESL